MTKVLNFTIGNSCDEAQFETSKRAIKTTLFANLDDKIECIKVLSVNFMVEDMFTTIKTLPPFIHRIELKSHVRLKITILLEDGNLHTFYHHVLLEPGSHHTSVSCKFNPDAEKRAAKPMPLTDRSYHIELDLQVPYPYSRSSYCHPSKIAEYLESRSEMRCVYTGFYPEEIDPEGGNQIPPYNFSGKGVMYRPYDENAAALRGPKRGCKRSKSAGGERSAAASASLIKTMYNGIPWKLAFDSKAPVNVSGSGQPSNLILISPVVRGQAGLGMIFNMLLVIAGASSEVHLKHRPGYRVGISILDMEFPQIVKIAQQYFKFEDVFESLTCDTPAADLHKQKSSAQTEVLYANGCDMKARARETTLYRENAVQGVSKKKLQYIAAFNNKLPRYSINSLENAKFLKTYCKLPVPIKGFPSAKCETADTWSSGSRAILSDYFATNNHIYGNRMEKNRMSMHFLSCFIQLVLRLVDNSATAPPPKMFVKKGPGKSFSYREEKFFYWLIRDRYLRDEFTDMRRQQRMGETLADDIAVALDKLTQAPRSGVPIITTGRLTVEEMRVESRRQGVSVGVVGKSSPKEISIQSFSDVLGDFPEDEKTDVLVGSQRPHPTSPTNAIPSNVKNGSSSSRNGKLRSKQLVNTSAIKKVEFIKNTS